MQIIYTTCPDVDVAEKLASELLEQQLIACANITEGITSLYRWEGSVRQETECVVMLKTDESMLEKVMGYVEEHHPYECPALFSLAPQHCSQAFAEWVKEQTVT